MEASETYSVLVLAIEDLLLRGSKVGFSDPHPSLSQSSQTSFGYGEPIGDDLNNWVPHKRMGYVLQTALISAPERSSFVMINSSRSTSSDKDILEVWSLKM